MSMHPHNADAYDRWYSRETWNPRADDVDDDHGDDADGHDIEADDVDEVDDDPRYLEEPPFTIDSADDRDRDLYADDDIPF